MFKSILIIIAKLFVLRFKKKSNKKILLVAEYNKAGGARTYFISLLKFLKNEQYQVTILMNNQQDDAEIDSLIRLLDFKILALNFEFWCIDFENIHPGLTKMKLINYQLREMRFWCRIMGEDYFSKILFSVSYPEQYLYAFLLPVQVRYILHTQPLHKADKYKRWMLRKTLGPKKQIFTVSHSSKTGIEAYWLKSQNNKFVKVVYNYYEPKFKIIHTIKRSHIKRVLTIGNVVDYKNPFFFIECAKQLIASDNKMNVIFTWAGDGNLLDECRIRAKDFHQIRFVGNKENVEKLYAVSDIYFQPSLQESHGIAVLGAMYYSLPCIVSDKGGLKESVEDGQTGFVMQVDNIIKVASKINRLLHDEHLCKVMGDNGYKKFSKKFTKEQWVNTMQNYV